MGGVQQRWRSSSGPSCPRQYQPTLTEMWPWAWGRWAAKNQSPGKGLLTLKMPEVRLGSVQLRVSEKTPGTAVSPGKCVCRGLMTGGAPDRKYLRTRTRRGGKQAMRGGWEMGRRGRTVTHHQQTSRLPTLTHATRRCQVRGQHRRGRGSSQELTQTVVKKQSGIRGLGPQSYFNLNKGPGSRLGGQCTYS